MKHAKKSALCWAFLVWFCFTSQAQTEADIANAFAPVFYQALGDSPRFDYITRFDFDGDWRGDNNWENAESAAASFLPYVYYAVSETPTHYFIHYAVFHPRDYKGGEKRGRVLGELLRQGAGIVGKRDPTGLLNEAALAHENDMEGCLIVVEKAKEGLEKAEAVFVETLAHNRFLEYEPAAEEGGAFPKFKQQGRLVQLYIEPKGHGIEALGAGKDQAENEMLVYVPGEKAVAPTRAVEGGVTYELLPLAQKLWPLALKGENETYGATQDFGTVKIEVWANGKVVKKSVKIGKIGAAFRGLEGMPNAARPPWGWFDSTEKDLPPGQWFFDPAATIKRHFKLDDKFFTAYVRQPFLGVGVEAAKSAAKK
jgi:hypothetical protein